MIVLVWPPTSDGTTAFTWPSPEYSSGATLLSNSTCVPPSVEATLPLGGGSVAETPICGPSPDPKTETISPGDTNPMAPLAAFATAATVTVSTVSVTGIAIRPFAAPLTDTL